METGDQVTFADLPQKLDVTLQPSLWEEEVHEPKETLQLWLLLCLSVTYSEAANSESSFVCQASLDLLLIGKGPFPFRQKSH